MAEETGQTFPADGLDRLDDPFAVVAGNYLGRGYGHGGVEGGRVVGLPGVGGSLS